MIKKVFKKNNKGFVILFAVTLSSIILAIALGVSNVALKEIKFGTSAKDTNEAFFAADTGAEYVLNEDKKGSYPLAQVYSVTFSNLGINGQSCAKATIDKTSDLVTTVISKGYNSGGNDPSCVSTSLNRIEREIKISY